MEAQAAGLKPAGRRWRHALESRRVLAPLLIAPAVIFMVLVVGVPFVWAIYLSFTDAIGGSLSGNWVGFDNFTNAWQDENFRRAVRNTLIFTLASQAIVLVGAAVLSNFLVRDFRGKWIIRFLVVLPWAAPVVLSTIGWLWLLDSLYSVINWTLARLHLDDALVWLLGAVHLEEDAQVPLQWLGRPNLALIAITLVHAWRILPFAVVIFIAGRASIPNEVEDAAKIDGATGLKKLWFVDIPLQLPIALVAVLFGIVFTAVDFAVVYILTRGGPFNSTQVLPTWAYFVGIDGGSLGEGAAISLFLFPLLVLVSVLMLFFAKSGAGDLMPRRQKATTYAVVVPFAALLAFPFYFALVTMFKTNLDLANVEHSPYLYNDLEGGFHWDFWNYATTEHVRFLFEDTNYATWLLNTLLVGAAVVGITLVLAMPAGYALARLAGGWGQSAGVAIFLIYLIPPTLLFLPLSRLITQLDLKDSLWALILVYPSFTVPFATWLLMGFFKTIPNELEDAALIDGASRLKAFALIVLPISLPGILTVVIFAFSLCVNEFIYAFTFISSSEQRTVSAGVPNDLIRGDVFFWQSLMAAVLIPAIPLALLYNAFLDRFIKGFTGGAFR